MSRRLILICTLGALAGIFTVPLHPVNSTILKLSFLGCIVGAWIGITILVWKRKPLRIAALLVPVVFAIPFLLPGRAINATELREDYVQRMADFEKTQYYWGGESSRGIDCSGLPRRALRDALMASGIRQANGRAIRESLNQWWFDASAKAMSEGYRNCTIPLGISGTVRDLDYEKLMPGDLAVTSGGVHVLAYMGEGKWIQADPGFGAVLTLDGRTGENVWFSAPVTVHRWQILAQR